jgi:hypothetical protein
MKSLHGSPYRTASPLDRPYKMCDLPPKNWSRISVSVE